MSNDIGKRNDEPQAPAGERPPGGRRGFLAGAGAAGAAGIAAVTLGTGAAPTAGGASGTTQKDPGPGKARGYHETAHIRKYYDTTRV